MAKDKSLHELVYADAPFSIEVMRTPEDSVVVKGFVSVEKEDRDQDIVPPEAFDVATYMAAPAVLVNHQLWIDQRGNQVSVGVPLKLVPVRLENIPGDKENFAVKDLKTKQVIDTYPKVKVPRLKNKDRGLFTVIKVTDPDVKQKILAGEIGGFSWRGLAKTAYRVNKQNEVERVFDAIDLWEISFTSVIDNPYSTFTVSKALHCLKLDKSTFESPDVAKEYLSKHGLDISTLRETDEAYFSSQASPGSVNLNKLVCMKMADGVSAVAGPLAEDYLGVNNEVLSEEDLKVVCSMGLPNKGKDGTMPEETVVAPEKTEVSKGEDRSEAMNFLVDHVSEKIAEGFQPVFENIVTVLKSVGESITSKKEVETVKEPEEKEEVEKSVVWNKLAVLASTLKETQEQLAKVTEIAESAETKAEVVSKSAPTHSTREETLESNEKDPNAVFDSVFPFIR